jgi:hypothetical protein
MPQLPLGSKQNKTNQNKTKQSTQEVTSALQKRFRLFAPNTVVFETVGFAPETAIRAKKSHDCSYSTDMAGV